MSEQISKYAVAERLADEFSDYCEANGISMYATCVDDENNEIIIRSFGLNKDHVIMSAEYVAYVMEQASKFTGIKDLSYEELCNMEIWSRRNEKNGEQE